MRGAPQQRDVQQDHHTNNIINANDTNFDVNSQEQKGDTRLHPDRNITESSAPPQFDRLLLNGEGKGLIIATFIVGTVVLVLKVMTEIFQTHTKRLFPLSKPTELQK